MHQFVCLYVVDKSVCDRWQGWSANESEIGWPDDVREKEREAGDHGIR